MPAESTSPVTDFIDKTKPMMDGANEKALAPGQPLVPFQTALKLTGDQEKKMLDHAFGELAFLSNECGRDQTINPTWWINQAPAPNLLMASQGLLPANTFLGKRSRFDATFGNDVSWRPWTMGPDNIFMTSNLVVPLSRRICRQMIARAKNAFFGSEPWFSTDPTAQAGDPVGDELATQIERFCRFKLKESQSQQDKERAIQRALILGECPVKTNYVVRDQLFNIEATVLTNVDGEPVKGTDGNHITPDDEFVDAEDGAGTRVLKRDGVTEEPTAPIWNKIPINRRQVLFEGARSEPIYYKDFLCSLTAKDVQEAPTVIHLYDKAVAEFVDLVVKRGMVDDSSDGRKQATQKMVALIQKLGDNDSSPKAAVTQELRPNENFSPVSQGDPSGGPVAEFAEFYMWFDANGDGIAENIMLIADRKNRTPIFYDHVANVTTDGLRPIEVIRINPVEGRWYGLGVMELFESYQTIIDLMVNRWNFSQSRSGRVDLWTPTNTLEGDRDPSLKMNWGGTYTKKPNVKAADVLETIYLEDTKFEKLKEMIDFFNQFATNESGVSNANDAQAAGLKSSDLATGIINIQQSGDELFKPIITDLTGPLTRLVEREIDVTLANMNPQEAFAYGAGDTQQIATLTPEDVRGLKFKVTIELTAHKNQQQIQNSGQVIALIKDFYAQPPIIQMNAAIEYRRQLRALSPSCDVDHVIVPQGMPMVAGDGGTSTGEPEKPGAPNGEKGGGGKQFAAQAQAPKPVVANGG